MNLQSKINYFYNQEIMKWINKFWLWLRYDVNIFMNDGIKRVFLFINRLIIETKYARADTRYLMGKLSKEALIDTYTKLDTKYNKILDKYGKKD